jgi:hypothetical protein
MTTHGGPIGVVARYLVAGLVVAGTAASTASLLLAAPAQASAAPAPVPCSASALIAAINTANSAGGGQLSLTRGCTYTLTAAQRGTEDGLPPIRSPITIDGMGATITRSTAPHTSDFRIFEVLSAPARLTLRTLTISNGNAPGAEPDGGGGIEVRETGGLVASVLVVRNNVGARGAGINNFGTTDITTSVIQSNAGVIGAGLANSTRSGTLRLTSTLVTGNRSESDAGVAGGLSNQDGGTVRLVSTAVKGNIGDNSAGGIRNDHDSVMYLTSSQVSGNRAGPLFGAPTVLTGGGIQNLGAMVVQGSSIDHNHAAKTELPTIARGGGVANLRSDEQGASPPTLTLTNSAVVNNVGDDGPGGIYNDRGSVVLQRTPVTGNKPTNCAGSPTPVPGCSG